MFDVERVYLGDICGESVLRFVFGWEGVVDWFYEVWVIFDFYVC